MVRWYVDNGNLKLLWEGADDLISFLNSVVAPQAKAFGVEISTKKAEQKVIQIVRQ